MRKKNVHISVIEFANAAGVGRQAIYQKLRIGELVKMPNGKMDILNPTNALYISSDHSAAKRSCNGTQTSASGQINPPPVTIGLVPFVLCHCG